VADPSSSPGTLLARDRSPPPYDAAAAGGGGAPVGGRESQHRSRLARRSAAGTHRTPRFDPSYGVGRAIAVHRVLDVELGGLAARLGPVQVLLAHAMYSDRAVFTPTRPTDWISLAVDSRGSADAGGPQR